jgi:hypothetical protein
MFTTFQIFDVRLPAAGYSRNASCALLSKPLILSVPAAGAAGTLRINGLESSEHDAFLE